MRFHINVIKLVKVERLGPRVFIVGLLDSLRRLISPQKMVHILVQEHKPLLILLVLAFNPIDEMLDVLSVEIVYLFWPKLISCNRSSRDR
jgi:hypothetical protein